MAGRLEVDRVPETHRTVECVEGAQSRGDAGMQPELPVSGMRPHVTGTSRSLKAGCGERRPLLRAFIVLAK